MLSMLGSCSFETTWRERWWDYYDRGVNRIDEGDVDGAISDFNVAIGKRFRDQFNARMYGMHFIRQYFPHRELGIALIGKGEYEGAIQELETSLSQLDSAKTRHYLDEGRRGYLNETGADQAPPTVDVVSHMDGEVVAALEATIRSRATDDFYVSEVSVGGERVKLDVSDREVTFEKTVTLTPGINRIVVEAVDLTGKRSEKVIQLMVDRAGPVISIVSPENNSQTDDSTAQFRGYAMDDSGIETFLLNGRPADLEYLEAEGYYRVEGTFSLAPGTNALTFEAIDSIGNTTSGMIQVSYTAEGLAYLLPGSAPVLVASSSAAGAFRAALRAVMTGAVSATGDLRVEVTNLEDGQVTPLKDNFLMGTAESLNEIMRIRVNEEPLKTLPGKVIWFSHKLSLAEGSNEVTVLARDTADNESTVSLSLTYERPTIYKPEHRMSLAVLPFGKLAGEVSANGQNAQEYFSQGLFDLQRFRLVERQNLDRVLEEQQLSGTQLVDKDRAVQLGKIVGADATAFAELTERSDGIELRVRIVDNESTDILFEDSAFSTAESQQDIEFEMLSLADKITRAFPLVGAEVIEADGLELVVEMNTPTDLREGTRMILYQEQEVVSSKTGKVLGYKTSVLGDARLGQSIGEGICLATVIGETLSGDGTIETGYKVFTR